MHQSENRGLPAVEDQKQFVFRFKADGTLTFINDRLCHCLGKTVPELLGQPWQALLLEQDVSGVEESLRALSPANPVVLTESRALSRDGKLLWIQYASCAFYNSEAGLVDVHSVGRDITERKQTEDKLRRSEAFLNNILEHSPHSMWISDANGTLLRTNQALRNNLAVKNEELIGKYNVFQDDVIAEQGLMPVVREAFEQGKTVRFAVVYDSAKVKHVQLERTKRVTLDITISPILGSDGKVSHAIIQHLDITEQKQAEQALRESEARFATVFRASPIAIVISRLGDGLIIDANDRFLSLYGYVREELVGRSSITLGLWPYPEERDDLIRRLREQGHVQQLELRFRRKTGEVGHMLVAAELIDLHGEQHLLGLFSDITERKRIEERLRQTHKMEGIGHLAGGIAHEFNNILAAMTLNLALVEGKTQDSETRESLQSVGTLSKRAAELVRQLLAFSRQSVMKAEPLDLHEVLRSFSLVLRRLASEQVVFTLSGDPGLPRVKADKGMIEQVLLNLCLNARDAMPQGGNLSIHLRVEMVDAERAKTHPDARPGRFVCLSVTDTGCGISEAIRPRLFEPFVTTKEVGKGTGLGLAMVYGIIQQHQGWVEVETQVGRGTTFRILLPAISGVEKQETSAPTPAPDRGHGETILLVEDEEALRKAARLFLQQSGYQVLEAADGQEAVAVWAERRGDIDLLLTDMIMPGGMTGLELTQRLRQDKPGVKVIICSGYSTEQSAMQAKSPAAITYLPKPLDPDELISVLQTCLKEK